MPRLTPFRNLARYATHAALFSAAFALAQVQEGATPDEAVRFHQARVQSRPGDVDALLHLSGALIKRAEVTGAAADYDDAWSVLDQAAQLEPGSSAIPRERAALLLSRHRFVLARALAEAALKKYPREAELYAIAGDAALEIDDLKAAGAHFQEFHKLTPGYASLSRLAHIEELQGRFDTAWKLMAQAYDAAAKRGSSPEILAWCRAIWGEMELKAGRKQSARKHYQLGLAASPKHSLVLEHLAELEESEGNLAAAEKAYRDILTGGGIHPEIQLRLARIIEARDPAEAARLRAETYQLLSRLVEAGNEGYLRPLAEMDLAKGKYQQAASLAWHDLSLRPNAESRELVDRILSAAAAAGQALTELSVDRESPRRAESAR